MKKIKMKKQGYIAILLIILFLLFEIINPFKLYHINKLTKLNYSKESAEKIIKYGIKEDLYETSYSKLIDTIVLSKDFNVKNIDTYIKLDYYEDADCKLINSLIDKKYKDSEINIIIHRGNNDDIKDFIKKDKYEDFIDFLEPDYSSLSNLDRYFEYQKVNLTDTEDTVLQVEIGLDKEFYEDPGIVTEFSTTVLVNKYNQLSENFVPENLVTVKEEYAVSSEEEANGEMLEHFYKMADDCYKETGYHIYLKSGYRSYTTQDETYEFYKKAYGTKYATNYVALAGYSEHQTGLAADIKAESGQTFDGTKESTWLAKNAYKYGFIHRYIKDKASLTGYSYEAWHYRYIGTEASNYCYDNGLTFDEYYTKFIKYKDRNEKNNSYLNTK